MKCPHCFTNTKVLDKRESKDATRRRRECLKCKRRFTTYERQETHLVVIKKDGRREPYIREKIKNGILKACEKRPVSQEKIDKVLSEIEEKIKHQGKNEVSTSVIGECLGYFVDYKDRKFNALLRNIRERVDKRGKTLIKKLNKIGYVVEYRNVRKKYGYPVMKIHVIYYLSNNCKNKKLFEELRKEVYSPKGRAYFEIKFDKTEKIIHAIIKAHGVPVLAHPWFTENWDCRLGKLVKAGLKGIEINSPMSDKIKNRKEIVKKIKVYSKRYNLINTSGSDFHAVDRNNFNLKKHGCDYKIVEKLRRMTDVAR